MATIASRTPRLVQTALILLFAALCSEPSLARSPGCTGSDSDHDGVKLSCDNCPTVFNPGQGDWDHDGTGDACDDSDGDGVNDDLDNCRTTQNPLQEDHDRDGLGDACDAWTMCAVVNDPNIHVPPDYETFTATAPGFPGRGGTYADQVSGCQIRRLTDGVADFNSGMSHDYSTMNLINSDGTRAILNGAHGSKLIYDLKGNLEKDWDEIGTEVVGARWSVTDPDVLYYYTDFNPADINTTNYVRSLNLATCARTTLLTVNHRIGWGGWELQDNSGLPAGREGDISDDGTYLVVSQDLRNHRLLNVVTGATSAVLGGQAGFKFADPLVVRVTCDTTPLDRVVCRFDYDAAGGGPRDYVPVAMRLYRYDWTTQVWSEGTVDVPVIAHGDLTWDPTGTSSDPNDREAWVAINDNTPKSPTLGGCDPPGIEKVRLSDMQRTCLLSFKNVVPPGGGAWFGKSVHVSANNTTANPHPWVLVSTNDAKNHCDTSAWPDTRGFTLPGDWASRWGTYFNELILVSLHTDPNDRQVHRLAHHRARDGASICSPWPAVTCGPGQTPPCCAAPPSTCDPGFDPTGYWSLTRATLSRDAKYVLFDSNFDRNTGTPRYNDVYVVSTGYPPQTPTPSACAPCESEYCADVHVRCTWDGASGPCGTGVPSCYDYTCRCDQGCAAAEPPPVHSCPLPFPNNPDCGGVRCQESFCKGIDWKCTATACNGCCCLYTCGSETCSQVDECPPNACPGTCN